MLNRAGLMGSTAPPAIPLMRFVLHASLARARDCQQTPHPNVPTAEQIAFSAGKSERNVQDADLKPDQTRPEQLVEHVQLLTANTATKKMVLENATDVLTALESAKHWFANRARLIASHAG